MAKNKKFLGYGILLSILGIVFMFLYSGLQNDQINIIQAFSGWSGDATMAPMTVGNFVCIVLTFLYGTMFIKFGVKKSVLQQQTDLHATAEKEIMYYTSFLYSSQDVPV